MPCMIGSDILTFAYNTVGLLLMPLLVLSSNDNSNVAAMWPLIPDIVRNPALRFLKLRESPLATHVHDMPISSSDGLDLDANTMAFPSKRKALDQARPSGVHFIGIKGSGDAVETLLSKAPFLLKGVRAAKSGKKSFDSKLCLFTVPISSVQLINNGKIAALIKMVPTASQLFDGSLTTSKGKEKALSFSNLLRLSQAMLAIIMAGATPHQKTLIVPADIDLMPRLYIGIWCLGDQKSPVTLRGLTALQYLVATAPDSALGDLSPLMRYTHSSPFDCKDELQMSIRPDLLLPTEPSSLQALAQHYLNQNFTAIKCHVPRDQLQMRPVPPPTQEALASLVVEVSLTGLDLSQWVDDGHQEAYTASQLP
ncbi:hypothetical protein V8C86DRAFT_2447376 [Haematococcus lacustris]